MKVGVKEGGVCSNGFSTIAVAKTQSRWNRFFRLRLFISIREFADQWLFRFQREVTHAGVCLVSDPYESLLLPQHLGD